MKLKIILILFACVTLLPGCQFGGDSTMPDDLVGVWKTSAPKYVDRSLEFTKESIIFGTGGGKTDTRPISKVKKVQKDNNILYTASYTNQAGQVHKFAFYFNPADGGTIRFKNQDKIVWRKEEG